MPSQPTSTARRLTVCLLGPFEVRIDDRRCPLGGSRQEKLLATLFLSAGDTVTTAALIDALWGDRPPDTARRQIHNAIAALRRSLDEFRTIVRTERDGYRLDAGDSVVDADRFARTVEAARADRAAGDPDAAIEKLSAGLALWRGRALQGMTGQNVEAAAARLDEQRLAARELLIECRLDRGESNAVVPEVTELVAVHPFWDSFRRQLIVALHRAGRQAEALHAYERARVFLADELGMSPGEELRELHSTILRSDSPDAAPRPEPAAPAPAESPARPDAPAPRFFLPYAVADFTGRTAEVGRLVTMAESTDDPAVVITAMNGMAGIGKTTIAVRVAHLVARDYPDGQLFIDLHGYTPGQRPLDPANALDVLLRTLGVPPEQIPDGVQSRAGAWRSALAGRRMLVVLDNAKNAEQVRPLLPGAPGVRVLVTSRHRLSTLEGTTSFSIDLMPPAEAADLFRRVAGPDRTDADSAARVVELCGHLPLAIRIAAARFRNHARWTVEHLIERLRDERRRLTELSSEDRSVMAAFAVSYGHLDAPEQRAFRFLSLHPGADFEVYGASALLGVGADDAERLLENLLDANLLSQHAVDRYHFHDLLRQYARATAERDEPAASRREAVLRLAEHYLALGRAGERIVGAAGTADGLPGEGLPELRSGENVREVVDAEQRNFSAIIRHAAENGLHEQTWRLVAVLCPALLRHGQVEDTVACYRIGLAAAKESGDRDGMTVLYRNLSTTYVGLGRFDEALDALGDGLAIERERGDSQGAGRMLGNIAIVHMRQGQYEEALTHLDRSRELLYDNGTARDRAAILGNLGVVHSKLGRYGEAARYHREALAINTEQGNRAFEVSGLVNVGWTCTLAGELDTAADHLRRALELSREVGAREDEARSLYLLADCLLRGGEPERALEHCREGLVLAREIANPDIEGHALDVLGRIHERLGDLDAAGGCFDRLIRLSGRTGQNFKEAFAYDGLGRIAAVRGERAVALDHWERSLAAARAARLPEAAAIEERIAELRGSGTPA
ncbi:AfsR/SARP family transcriptional regulator [Amycolatopsis antarctica]|nr:BTAD domain-containing putative transcriptional regulator [Amycolatopsis antarctica]